jgi:drug/metabolite transporter (DMT)-like permease
MENNQTIPVYNRARGIGYIVLASMAFAVMGAFAKILGAKFNSVEIVFFRNFFGCVALLVSIYFKPLQNIGGKPFLLAFRGIIGTFSLYCFAYTLTTLTLGEAFTFYQTSSIFIAFFSFVFLGQTLNKWGILALLLGFMGIATIFRPDIDFFKITNLFGLLSGLGSALAYMSVSELNKLYDKRAIVMSFMISGSAFAALSMLIGSFYHNDALRVIIAEPKMPNWSDALSIIGIGVGALLGQYFATIAYSAEKPGIVSVASYSNIVFSILLGVLLGDQFPDSISQLGILLIIISGVIISLVKEI